MSRPRYEKTWSPDAEGRLLRELSATDEFARASRLVVQVGLWLADNSGHAIEYIRLLRWALSGANGIVDDHSYVVAHLLLVQSLVASGRHEEALLLCDEVSRARNDKWVHVALEGVWVAVLLVASGVPVAVPEYAPWVWEFASRHDGMWSAYDRFRARCGYVCHLRMACGEGTAEKARSQARQALKELEGLGVDARVRAGLDPLPPEPVYRMLCTLR